MNKNTKIIFFGTPQYAVPALEKLIESGIPVISVVTRADKPTGRKKTLTPPPVKDIAKRHGIRVLQPEKITDEFINKIRQENPDLFVVVAYGKILPKKLIDIPKHGSINIHPSLLPLYRGPSPLQYQILDGLTKSGVSIMLMDEKMDHGPIIANFESDILESDNCETLGKKLFQIGADNLPETICKYIAGDIVPKQQDHDKATYCEIIKKEDGKIDWNSSADYIEKMTRAYHPWPGAFSQIEGIDVKIIKAKVSNLTLKQTFPGKASFENDKLLISCGNCTTLEVLIIQPSGKKQMKGSDFARGYIKNND